MERMHLTTDKEKRARQKAILRGEFEDYDPKRHDYFVALYNNVVEQMILDKYHHRRGITPCDCAVRCEPSRK